MSRNQQWFSCIADGQIRRAPPGFDRAAAAALPPSPELFFPSHPSQVALQNRLQPPPPPPGTRSATSPVYSQPGSQLDAGPRPRSTVLGQRIPAAKIMTPAPAVAVLARPQLQPPVPLTARVHPYPCPDAPLYPSLHFDSDSPFCSQSCLVRRSIQPFVRALRNTWILPSDQCDHCFAVAAA